MIRWARRKFCSHEFSVGQIAITGIKPPPEPSKNDYALWSEWFSNYYNHDFVTKRVWAPCRKCRNGFYANCGLDLPGKLIR